MRSERGKLLFKWRTGKGAQRFPQILWIWGAITILFAADSIYSYYRGGRMHFTLSGVWVGYTIGLAGRFYFKGWNVAFYENGVLLPEDPTVKVQRFFPWAQIERYYWEGDVLTIVPGTSFLAGGGGSVGLPVMGGSVQIPAMRRAEVEKLLSAIPAI